MYSTERVTVELWCVVQDQKELGSRMTTSGMEWVDVGLVHAVIVSQEETGPIYVYICQYLPTYLSLSLSLSLSTYIYIYIYINI